MDQVETSNVAVGGESINEGSSLPCQPLETCDQVSTRKRRRPSRAWDHFSKIGNKIVCDYCKMEYPNNVTKNEMSTLLRHLLVCKGMPARFAELANMFAREGMVIAKKVDQMMVSKLLALAIIEHDLPFSFVEYKRIRLLLKYLNPDFKPISRNTIVAEIIRLHQGQKDKLKVELANIPNRICLTADVWRSIAIEGYICVIAHYVDHSWALNSKILSFSAFPPPHSGLHLANKVFDCLKDWGVEKKVFSVTLDNASANDSMQDMLKDRLRLQNGLLCNGQFFHVRCCTHILNLIVQEGLKVVDSALYKIRESVKYVKWSEGRMQMFEECCCVAESRTGLRLDVPTRWNSTYLMLKVAIQHEHAFNGLQLVDRNYKHCPSVEEWKRGTTIFECLEPFYEITNLFSGSKYMTSNLYFFQVWRIECLLKDYMQNGGDELIKTMASDMKMKFDKYWDEYSVTLALGAVLYPRMKLELLEFAYNEVDPTTSQEKMDLVKRKLFKLFDQYKSISIAPSSSSGVTSPSWYVSKGKGTNLSALNAFKAYERRNAMRERRSTLQIYLDDKRLEMNEFDDIDVLQFWESHKQRYGDLARMACDVLSIPITTVASESSFSIDSRLLSKYRSRIRSSNVEALICTRTWLISYEFHENVDEACGDDENHDKDNVVEDDNEAKDDKQIDNDDDLETLSDLFGVQPC